MSTPRGLPCLRRRTLVTFGASLLIIAACGVMLYRGLTYLDGVDWNPLVRHRELIGLWRDGDSSLSLDSGGTYVCSGSRCGDAGHTGDWHFDTSFTVELRPGSDVSVTRRLAVRDGLLCLVDGTQKDDPDEWNPRFTFVREVPWDTGEMSVSRGASWAQPTSTSASGERQAP